MSPAFGFRQLISSEQLAVEFGKRKFIKDFLEQDEVFGRASSDGKSVEFEISLIDEWYTACFCEADRFLSVAIQSYYRATNGIPNSNLGKPWQLIEHYYVSFYAIHGLMRMCSVFPIYLDAREIRQIAKIADRRGVDIGKLSAGLYEVKLDPSNNKVAFHPGDKNSHYYTWHLFGGMIKEVQERVKMSPIVSGDRDRLIEVFAALQRQVPFVSGYPSELRNAINYKFQHGVWLGERKSELLECEAGAYGDFGLVDWPASKTEAQRLVFLARWLMSVLIVLSRECASVNGSIKRVHVAGFEKMYRLTRCRICGEPS